jgi:di/tricarboxylate transporter
VQALLFLCFVYLYCPPAAQAHYIKVDTRQLKEAYHRMGPMSFPQKVILVDFVGLALLWYLNSTRE